LAIEQAGCHPDGAGPLRGWRLKDWLLYSVGKKIIGVRLTVPDVKGFMEIPGA
jgi:hypothetical protein